MRCVWSAQGSVACELYQSSRCCFVFSQSFLHSPQGVACNAATRSVLCIFREWQDGTFAASNPSQRMPGCSAKEISTEVFTLQIRAVCENELLQKKSRMERHHVYIVLVFHLAAHTVSPSSRQNVVSLVSRTRCKCSDSATPASPFCAECGLSGFLVPSPIPWHATDCPPS